MRIRANVTGGTSGTASGAPIVGILPLPRRRAVTVTA